MKWYALPAIAAGLFLAVQARPQQDVGEKKGQLRGEWQLVSTRDEKHTDPGCDESRMIVRADGEVVFELAGVTMNRGAFTFGRSGKLRLIDLRLANGDTMLGVYERKGDDLGICFAEAGRDRPAGMAPRGTQWAETWKRVKPGGR